MRKISSYGLLPAVICVSLGLLGCGEPTELVRQETYPEQRISDLDGLRVLDGFIINDQQQAAGIEQGPVWYYTEDDIDPAAETARLLAGGKPQANESWQAVEQVPAVLPSKPKEGWYLKTFHAPDHTYPLALRLGVIEDRDVAYLNGVRIGSTGEWDAEKPQAYDRIRLYSIPKGLERPNARNVLLIHFQGYFPQSSGIVSDTVVIGPAWLVLRDFYVTQFTQLILLAMYFAVGLYFLFLFVRRLKERENLLFGLFVMSLIAYQFLRTQFKYELGFSFFAMKRVEYMVLFYMPPLFYYFLRTYFDFPKTKFMKVVDVFMAAVTAIPVIGIVLILFNDNATFWNQYNVQYVQKISYPPTFLGMLGLLIYQVIKRHRDGFYILLGLLAMMVAAILDMASNQHVINLPRMTGYAFMLFILNIAVVLANRFVRLHGEVEDLNANLEKKVEERTEQLKKSLAEIQALKEQQDGDYWLTSLLVKPLGGLFSRTSNVNVDLLERQKKRFRFRKWESEIGGDLNAVHAITLRGRRYTAFINGDAMGKSIQGAGGALVLGVVFKSVLARTELSSHARTKYPEQWLKECFIEFQNVFVSFDGSMLMSAVMGLLDDETGLVYYINAEHPWVVLYRNGRAEFIENEMLFRKLGTTGISGQLQVKTFQMQPDDVLLIGSDGRDDILLSEQNGQRVINEDENEFLRRVEEGGGMLLEIEEAILRQGRLTDDFSLIRIGYKEDAPYREVNVPDEYRAGMQAGRKAYRDGELERAVQQYEAALVAWPDNPDALQELGQVYFKLKNYEQAVEKLERYTDLYPGQVEFLYMVSFCYKQLRQYDRAADFGERCRLRAPDNIKNLVNLADIYRLAEKNERAEMLLNLALEMDPDYKNAHRLQEALRKAG